MAEAPRGYTKKDTQVVRQRVATGVKTATAILDGSTSDLTQEVIRFGGAMSKVSWQCNGTLAGTIEFSIDGLSWFGSTALTGTTPASYNTHNVEGVRVTWTSGSGQCFVAGT